MKKFWLRVLFAIILLSCHDCFIYGQATLDADKKLLIRYDSLIKVKKAGFSSENYKETVSTITKAIALADELNDKERALSYRIQLVNEHFKKSEWAKVIISGFEVIARKDAVAFDQVKISQVYASIADAYSILGHFDQGIKYSEIAINIAENQVKSEKQIDLLHRVYSNMAQNIYYDQGEYQLSLELQEKALRYAESINNYRAIIFSLFRIALVKVKQGDFKAVDSIKLRTARILNTQIIDDRSKAYCKVYLGEAYLEMGNFVIAEELLTESSDIADKLENTDLKLKSYEAMYKLKEKVGKESEAFHYFKLYHTAYSQVYNPDELTYASQSELKYEQDKRQLQERAEAQKRDILNNQRLRSERNKRYAVLAGLGVLAVFLIGSIRASKRSRKQKKIAEQLREKAEQSEKFKQQFLANMSHEIRTPMNAVMGMTNILLEKNPGDEQKNYLDRIKKSSENLLVIINDILDLSKIQEGKMELEKIDFSLKEAIELVRQTLQFKAEEKGLELKVNYDETIPTVLVGDPTRLNQILINLTGNAIKFTEKGSVTISVSKNADNSIVFEISDTGIGMTKEQLSKLFAAYQQAESGTNRKYGGTGLGLSISKHLVELHGGKIAVESEYNKGTTFSFFIQYQVSQNQDLAKADFEITPSMIEELIGIRILLAEDNEYNRIVATDILKLKIKNLTIDEAYNGQEAVELIRTKNYHVVLMDVQMPMMDGFEATEKIRMDLKSNIPIIAMTASVLRTDIEKCLDVGMNGYIPKPFRTSELILGIYNAVKGKRVDTTVREEKITGTEKTTITDLSFLKEFCECDEARMKKYISMYLNSAPKSLHMIKHALENQDYVTVQKTMHQLKAHLRYMGMKSTAGTADSVEEKCMNKTVLEELPVMIAEIQGACELSFKELS